MCVCMRVGGGTDRQADRQKETADRDKHMISNETQNEEKDTRIESESDV